MQVFLGKYTLYNKKKTTPVGIVNLSLKQVGYSSEIASEGQTPAQAPHSMHLSGSIT